LNPEFAHKPFSRSVQIAVVAGCTILGAGAQMLFKIGTAPARMPHLTIPAVLLNPTLMAGFALYALFTLLIVLALRDGELSTLYPIISLTYVWVTFLSVWLFHESMNVFKAMGVVTIVLGVGLLGRGGKK
jgi:drug/metabolite transporter (DMT)-like permease